MQTMVLGEAGRLQSSGVCCCPLPTGCTSAAAKRWKWVSALRCLGGSQLWQWVCVKLLLLGGPSMGEISSLVLSSFSRVPPTSFLERKNSRVLPPIPPACTRQVRAELSPCRNSGWEKRDHSAGMQDLALRIMCAKHKSAALPQRPPGHICYRAPGLHQVAILELWTLTQGSGVRTLLQPRAHAVLSWDHGTFFQSTEMLPESPFQGEGRKSIFSSFFFLFLALPVLFYTRSF